MSDQVTLRRHQAEAKAIGSDIAAGIRNDKQIAVFVTPGGGKTLLASLFAHELIKGDVDRSIGRVLAVCPRLTLRAQMAKGFRRPEFGCMHGLSDGYRSTRSLLRDDLLGVAATYQEIVADAERGGRSKWFRFAAEMPTLTVIDEAHHLLAPNSGDEEEYSRGWTQAIAPIIAVSHRVLIMTGTPNRASGNIAFLDYGRARIFDIEYQRKHALEEQAIVNVSVKLCDGDTRYSWRHLERDQQLSTATGDDIARALRTALEDPIYRNRVIDDALAEFQIHREIREPAARMIIIAKSQEQARLIARHIRDNTSWKPVLAISDEKGSHGRVAKFRDHGDGDILITVGMAHEGLDVPNCTHLVALTNIRQSGWLDQALSRATRFNAKSRLPWEQQYAYLYVPGDHGMASLLAEWVKEQDPRFDPPKDEPRPQLAQPRGPSSFHPISAKMTTVRYAHTNGQVSDEDQDRLRRLFSDDDVPLTVKALPISDLLPLARRMYPGQEIIK